MRVCARVRVWCVLRKVLAQETVADIGLDYNGNVYIAGTFLPYATGHFQGGETSAGGSDVFSLVQAKRGSSVGCDEDRRTWDAGGVPLCTLYSHADGLSGGGETGFLMKVFCCACAFWCVILRVNLATKL